MRTVRRIGVIAACVAVALLIGEALIFTLYRENVVIFPRYLTGVRYGGFHVRRNLPGSTYRHRTADGVWDFAINRNGFRDTRDFDYSKPEGTLRVLVLGDSYTIGYESDEDATYPAILERYLRGKGHSVEVLNAAMVGCSTAEGLVFLEQEGVRYEPDVVALGFSEADLNRNAAADLYRLSGGNLTMARTEFIPGIRAQNRLNSVGFYRWLGSHSWLTAYLSGLTGRRNARAMLDRGLELAGENASAEGMDPEEYTGALARALVERMRAIAASHGAEFVLVDIRSEDGRRAFPWMGASDRGKIADAYVDSGELLAEYENLTELTTRHGQDHWTPFAHVIVGAELGRVIASSRGAADSEAS